MVKNKKWNDEHRTLLRQQNSFFNPAKHFGLTNSDWTYFNLKEVVNLNKNWRNYFGNNILYLGKQNNIHLDNINNIFYVKINRNEIYFDKEVILLNKPDLIQNQKKILLRNIKAIVYEKDFRDTANKLQQRLDNFINAYPVNSFNPRIELYSVYTLIYGNIKPEHITDAIESILSQKTNQFYRLEYVFVLDPPHDKNNAKLKAILKDYEGYATFNIICNPKFLNYTGSYLKALKYLKGVLCFNQDIDDMSHPERFYWSNYYLQNSDKIKAISFVPIGFKDKINNSLETIFYRQSHLNDPCAVWLNANIFFNTISINPQCICMRNEIISDINLESSLVKECGLLGGDQFIVSSILYNYPLGIVNVGKVLYFYRIHENSACNSTHQGYYILKEKKIDYQETKSTLLNTKKYLAKLNIERISQNGELEKIKDYLAKKDIFIDEVLNEIR